MKRLAYKTLATAFCLLAILSVSITADAQKKKTTKRSTKARTTAKAKPKAKYVAPVETMPQTTAQVSSSPVTALASAVKDSLPADSLPPMDGFYRNEMYTNAKAFNYPAIDSRDVRFYKRVWRDIDINNPKNSLFNTPGATLAETVLEGLRTGKLTAYEPSATNGDSTFAKRINIRNAMSRFQDSTLVDQFDSNGNKIGSKMVLNDIYFDKKRSMVVTRIIGIAPLKAIMAAGTSVGEAPVFWLYFPQCRDFFATKDVSDPDRNLYDTSLDDIFVQRKYASTIVRATGSSNFRTTSQIAAAAIPGVTTADALNGDKDKAATSKEIEAKIQSFKDKTWNYEIQKKQTAAEKKAAEKAEKAAKDAEKNAKKNADKASKPAKS
jgi:gliding motility associated protien GldN